jgi:zinc transport system permease protein
MSTGPLVKWSPLNRIPVTEGLIGGLVVALVAAPMGCFILWRRMVFFGAAVSHSGLLGVALGLALGINVTAGVVLTAAAVAVILVIMRRDKRLEDDAILGVVAHGALALGLVALFLLEGPDIVHSGHDHDLETLLFGDIASITRTDLVWIIGGGGAGLVVMAAIWKSLLAMTVHEEMAIVEGVPVPVIRIVFMLTMAVVVGVALKVVGALLIVSLLIIPAAAARRLTTGPEAMAAIAAVIGIASVLGGLQAHMAWGFPAGPSVVVVAVLVFGLTFGVRVRRNLS